MRFRYALTRPGAKDLTKGHPTDAGIDFYVPSDFNEGKPLELKFGESVTIDSGVKVEIDPGFMGMFGNKGGVASKRNLVYGAHISDTYYTGNVFIDIHNIGLEIQTITPGEKIIQMMIVPVVCAIPECVIPERLYEGMIQSGIRGEGKQGSTGV